MPHGHMEAVKHQLWARVRVIGKFCLRRAKVFNLEGFELCDKKLGRFSEDVGGVVMFTL